MSFLLISLYSKNWILPAETKSPNDLVYGRKISSGITKNAIESEYDHIDSINRQINEIVIKKTYKEIIEEIKFNVRFIKNENSEVQRN